MNETPRSRTYERGQSLTELALFMVFLLILVAGIVDIGRAFLVYIEMRDVAQEAALISTYKANRCDQLIARVKTSTDSIYDLIDDGTVVISCNPGDICNVASGTNITIMATYDDFPLTMPFLGTLIGNQTVDISASIIDTVVSRDPDEISTTCPYP